MTQSPSPTQNHVAVTTPGGEVGISREQIEINSSTVTQHGLDIHTYQVTREQLEQIRDRASAGSDELALSTFLISMGITAICTLISATIASDVIRFLFCAAAIFGPILGGYFFYKWFRCKQRSSSYIDEILNAPIERRRPLH